MGISGLLPYVKKSCRPSKIDEFCGQTVAVDACCWLHKGAFGCAEKLVKNEKTDFYVHYCLKYVKMLLSYKIHVILVFDGASLPAKKKTDAERKERRTSMKTKGKRFLAEGKINEANDCFKKCAEITFEMISNLIEACNSLPNVDCIVAPYESDAQLAYFSKEGIAQLIITEDSDLILFGCTNIMFKMDLHGYGFLFEQKILHLSLGLQSESFDFVKFRRACILSGCDYLDGLAGIGLIKANKFFKKTSSNDLQKVLPKISSYLRMPGVVVNDNFIGKFIEAENTFLYQIIFDVVLREMKRLNPYPDETETDLSYAGLILEESLAYEVAVGNTNPYNHKKINNFDPAAKPPCSRSIWNFNYNPADSKCEPRPDSSNSNKKHFFQTSAFPATESRFVTKGENRQHKFTKPSKNASVSKESIHQLDDYKSREDLESSPQRIQPLSSVPKVHVVSRHFVNPFSLKHHHKETILESASVEQEKSALELLDLEDEGARLSDSFIKSPLSLFQTPSATFSSNTSQSETETPSSGKLLKSATKNNCSSPVFNRSNKRLLPYSPLSSSSNVDKTVRNLRKFCYVSPKKLFDSSKSKTDKSFVGHSSAELPDSGNGSLETCASGSSSTDSEIGKCSVESLDVVIDLTNDEDGVIEDYCTSSRKSLTHCSQSKYLQKCKPLGLGKPSNSSAVDNSRLKQSNIKDMFNRFAYKKS